MFVAKFSHVLHLNVSQSYALAVHLRIHPKRQWRAPGYNWTKTEFGWRTLQQRRRPEAAPAEQNSSPIPMQNVWKCQLDLCSVKVTQYTSRENSNYVTLGAAITKLNFLCAVNDQNCLPYICEVILQLFNNHWWSLSSSTQILTIKVIEAIKNAAIENKTYYVKAVRLIAKSVEALKKGDIGTRFVSQSQWNKTDTNIAMLQKWKQQLHDSLHEVSHDPGFLELPSVILRHVISYLTDPHDLLNFGLAHPVLQEMTEVPGVWYSLCVLHYKETATMSAIPKRNWKKRFSVLHKKHNSKIAASYNVLHMCPICNSLFWKSYGHPCTAMPASQQHGQQQQQQYTIISPEQFIQMLYF